MLVVNRLGPGAGRYYRDGPPGQWAGRAAGLLGLGGPVRPRDLDDVLAGRSPAGHHRLAGWDLILAAPKSISIVTASAPPPAASALVGAHGAAVRDALSWLEDNGCWARRRQASVEAEGLVAACFEHHRSAAGDPHLHAHVLVANLTRTPDGRWSALDSSGLWRSRRGLAAAYHLGLRQQLAAAGLTGPWVLRADGTFDLALVPAAAVAAASRRQQEVAAQLATRPAGGRGARRSARERTRGLPEGPAAAVQRTRSGAAEDPGARGPGDSGFDSRFDSRSDSGFGVADVGEALGPLARRSVPPAAGPDPSAVTSWLADRRSSFGPNDVMQALAATVPEGLAPAAAGAWAEQFVRGSPRAPDGRATTLVAAALDRAFVARCLAGSSAGVGRAAPALIAADAGADLVRLARAGHAVEILDHPPGNREALLPQAALLERARAAWEATGHTVALLGDEQSAARWQALSGVHPPRPGERATVLVVDRADRRSTPELIRLLDAASAIPAKLVLVRGGTLPARHRAVSEAFERLAVAAGTVVPQATLGAPQLLVQQVVSAWRRLGPGARMVGLGPAEVGALNSAARRLLAGEGLIAGPEVVAAGRSFAAGERVIPLRAGAGAPGASGTVLDVDPRRGTILVDWGPAGRTELDRRSARHLGYAYAVTPAGAALRPGPLAVLGPEHALGRQAARVGLALHAGLTAAERDERSVRSVCSPGRDDPAVDLPVDLAARSGPADPAERLPAQEGRRKKALEGPGLAR